MTRRLACLLVFTLAACEQQCAAVALKEWTPEEQRQMFAEEQDLPVDSILIPLIEDYAKLRREVR